MLQIVYPPASAGFLAWRLTANCLPSSALAKTSADLPRRFPNQQGFIHWSREQTWPDASRGLFVWQNANETVLASATKHWKDCSRSTSTFRIRIRDLRGLANGKGPLGGILGGITKALNPAANALGAGVGEGAIKGLKLESMMKVQTATDKKQESGLAGLAKNLGEGASEAIFSNIDISKLAPSAGTLALAANSLGSGLGNGTASGLKLSQNIAEPDPSQTGIPAVAGNLGFGLTGGLFRNIDTNALMSGPMSQGLMKMLAALPAPAGKGLGEGAAAGLKLPGTNPNTAVLATDPNGSNASISSVSEDFTRSLAASFLGQVNLQQLASGQMQNIMKQLVKIPGPAGKGLGEGAAQGLKLAAPPKVKRLDGGDPSTEQISEEFTRNLASSFLGSVNVKGLANSDQTAGLMKTLMQVPGPAGRGLGQGAAIGLKLAKPDAAPAQDGNGTFDAGTASESFTRELASSFLGNTNLKGQVDQKQLLATVAKVAPAVAQGLGRGAAAGLKKQGSAPASPAPPAPPAKGPNAKRQDPPSPADSPDIPGIAGDFSQNLAQSFIGNVDVSQLGGPDQQKQLLDTISKAAPFAGSGLGQGAAEGLGLTGKAPPPADAKGVMRRQDPGRGESSVGTIAQGFTRSLSSSFLSNANFSSLASKAAAQGTQMIGPAVQGFAAGLGGGAATGLGLQKDVQEPIDGQNIGSVLKGFSRSLTTSFLANGTIDNIQKKAASAGGSLPILPAAQGLAKGFGNGAASAFGLQEAAVLDPKASDVPTVAQGFSGSLTQSFLANGTIQKIMSMAGNQAPMMLGPIAEGLGKGFGGGAAESLGFQSAAVASNASDGPAVAQGFSRALTTSFLANGTLTKITQKAMAAGGGLTKNIDVSKAAEGLGIGLIDGGSQVIFMQTGMGNASLTTNSQAFNDSVGGAATGFGRGISSEAVKAVFMALGNKSIADKLAGTLGTGSQPLANTPAPSTAPARKRALDASAKAVKRQAQLNTTDAINAFVQNLNITTLNSLVQKGADTLGCTGVGGLIQVGAGLKENFKGQTPNLPNISIPMDQPINITSNGFLFQLDISKLEVLVNGITAKNLTILIVAHVVAVAAAFYFILPGAITLEAARDLVVLLNRPDKLAFADKTVLALQGAVIVMAAVGAGLGAAATGSAAHFCTPHQITGWITVVFGIVAAALHFAVVRAPGNNRLKQVRDGVAQLVLGLGQLEILLGFQDANLISFCLTQSIPIPMAFAGGGALTGVIFVSFGALAMRFVVNKWAGKREGNVAGGVEKNGGVDPMSRFSR
ncbi:hypothetical protein B0J12DRAFT_23770 [Macrophomina phaseolina]|uniref:Uncharacterized protein n=1 Tax=Macrophomina phaseolina TaxID=35725 RepID=A0ABQ8GUV7_9PEZI|nr:hypothetical protein B0J12DRAFT_23770 [Macrophomina phaseolina]